MSSRHRLLHVAWDHCQPIPHYPHHDSSQRLLHASLILHRGKARSPHHIDLWRKLYGGLAVHCRHHWGDRGQDKQPQQCRHLCHDRLHLPEHLGVCHDVGTQRLDRGWRNIPSAHPLKGRWPVDCQQLVVELREHLALQHGEARHTADSSHNRSSPLSLPTS